MENGSNLHDPSNSIIDPLKSHNLTVYKNDYYVLEENQEYSKRYHNTNFLKKNLIYLYESLKKKDIDYSILNLELHVRDYAYLSYKTEKKNKYSIEVRNKSKFNKNHLKYYEDIHLIKSEFCKSGWDIYEYNLLSFDFYGTEYFPIYASNFFCEDVFVNFPDKLSIIFIFNGKIKDFSQQNNLNELILSINENFSRWLERVKVNCLFYDNQDKNLPEKIIEYGWNQNKEIIKFYRLKKTKAFLNTLYINKWGKSRFIIIDENQIIRVFSDSFNKSHEKTINDLLDIKYSPKEENEFKRITEQIEEEERYHYFVDKYNRFKFDFQMIYNQIKENIKCQIDIEIGIEKKQLFEIENKHLVEIKNMKYIYPKIKIKCYTEKQIEFFYDLLKNHFTEEEITLYDFTVEAIKTFNILLPSHTNCNLCGESIDYKNELTYYCKICDIFFCNSCIKSNKNSFFIKDVPHKNHNLIVFKNPNENCLKNIDENRLGNHIISKYLDSDLKKGHNFECNICRRIPRGIVERYVCLNCRCGIPTPIGHFDVCSSCFERNYEYNHDQNNFNNDGHEQEHIYLFLNYSGDGYWDY